MEDVKVTRLINGPEAFTPDNEFCLGETEVRGLFVAAGFCAHGLAGAGGIGKVMAEWIVAGEPSLDVWEMDIRRFGAQYRSPQLHAQADQGGLRDLLRHPLSGPRAPGRAAAAGLQRLRLAPRTTAPRSARSPAGSGSTGTSPTPPPATRRCARAAGPGCTGRRRSAPSTAPPANGPGLFDESSFAKLEVSGPGAAELLERLCDNRVARDVGRDHLHADAQPPRRDRVRLHGHARRRGRLPDRHRDRVRQSRRGLDPQPRARRTAPCRCTDVTVALGVLRAVGAAGAGDPRAADPRPARLRLHAHARDHRRRRPGARAAGHVRRRARLGAVLPDRVRRGAVADAVGGRRGARPARRRLPRDRLAAPGEGLPRVGRRHHGRRDAAARPGSGSASATAKRSSAARAALRDDARRARLPRLRCVRAGRSPLGRARQRARARRRRDRRARHERRLRLHRRALDRLRLPAGSIGPGTDVEIDIFGRWVPGEVAREPLFDPKGERVRG